MRLFYSELFRRSYTKAPVAARRAFNRRAAFLLRNLRHPSLKAKKYDETRNIWQARVNGGAIRDLLVDSPEAHEYVKEKNRLALGETKFLPADFVIGIDILVYGNTVAMISPRNLIVVVVEDPAIAHAQRQFLEFLWRSV